MCALSSPTLTIRLLGAFDVRLNGTPVLVFESDKARALLAYLAVESAVPHRRDKLAGLLWPDWPNAEARTHLRHCLHNLRTILEDADASPPLLLVDRQSIQLNPVSRVHIDVCGLEVIATALPMKPTQPLDPALLLPLQQAITQYRGPFLDGFSLVGCAAFEEWLLLTRERLQNELATLLNRLTNIYADRGELAEAVQSAQRLVELDPFVEQHQRQLMRLLALNGQRNAALVRYATLCELLATELKAAPSPETIHLYQQIHTGKLASQPTQPRPESLDTKASQPSVRIKHNLPASLTSFVGRDVECSALSSMLTRCDVRLVTVVGAAGVGKTRLAIEVASGLKSRFANHICFVPLAELREPTLVINTIAECLGVPQRASQTLLETLISALCAQPVLLLLDNFEHLLSAGLAVADLLTAIPHLKILVTSREPLQLYGEHLFAVEPLSLPDDSGQHFGDAVQLFQERTQAVQPTFKVERTNLSTVAAICQKLDGLPLAIELAAARVRLLTVEGIFAQLTDGFTPRLDLLSSALRNVPDRHRTVRNTIEWSYRLLTVEEQHLFRHVALFVGAFDRSAAAAVCSELTPHAVADCLEVLTSKSLLKVTDTANYQPRFRMLETLRAFGLEQLALQQESDVAHLAYVCFYLNQVEDPALVASGERYMAALAAVSAHYADVRAALLWTLATNHLELTMRFCAALHNFWSETSRYREADRWLRQIVQAMQPQPFTVEYAAVLYTAGFSAMKLGDLAYAHDCFQRSLAAGIALQNSTRIGFASALLALVCFKQGDYAAAKTYYATSLEVRRQLDNWYLGMVLVNFGYAEACLGNLQQSLEMFQEGNSVLERADEAYGLVVSCLYRTGIARMQGDSATVQRCLEQAQMHIRQTPARHLQASIQVELAFLQAQQGHHELAQRTLQAAMQTFDELGYLSSIVEAADIWATLLALAGEAEAAIGVNAAVMAYMEQRELVRPPLEQTWLTKLLAPCAEALGTNGVAQAQHKGRLLGLNGLVQRYLGHLPLLQSI